MKFLSKIVSVIIGFFLFLIFITSSGYTEEARGVTDKTIKIGGIFDLTGPLVATIRPIVEGIRNYTRYTNDNGGLHGRKIKLIIEDDRYTISAAVAAFKKLIYRDKIFALIGPGSTGETRALTHKIMKQKLPTIPYAADKDIIDPYKRYLFLPLDTYGNQLGIIFDYIVKISKPNKPKIGVACADAGVKVSILKGVKKWSKFFNLEVKTIMLPTNVLDTTSEILSLKRAKIDYIITVHTIPTAALLLKDNKRFGLNAKIFGTYSLTSEDIIKISGKGAKNFYGVHPYSSWYDDNPGMDKLRKITLKYHPGTEKPYRGKNYAGGWIGCTLLCEGIKRAGKNLNAETFVNAMETITKFDTKGICGLITYTSKSHEGLKYDKVFHANPKTGKLDPITGWIKSPE